MASSESTSTFEYDVALSFAGEQRSYADQLAAQLTAAGVAVFYDLYAEAELWGKDLGAHLHEVYSQRARYVVMFTSKEYKDKAWTNHERIAAQERAIAEKGSDYILPIRIDDTSIPGIAGTRGYVSIDKGIPHIASLVLQKLRGSAGAARAETSARVDSAQAPAESAAEAQASSPTRGPNVDNRGATIGQQVIVQGSASFGASTIQMPGSGNPAPGVSGNASGGGAAWGGGVSNAAPITKERFIEELSSALWEPERARAVALAAGFGPGRIPVLKTPQIFWSRLVEEAGHGAIRGGVRAIAEAAAREFPGSQIFAGYGVENT